MNAPTRIERRSSTCPHDCPSACALEVEVIDGTSIGKVTGDAEQSYTAGVICAKVARYAERYPSPRAADPALAPRRPQGLGRIRADLLGGGSGYHCEGIPRGGRGARAGGGLAVLLCRHDGPRHARRHQPAAQCPEIFRPVQHDLHHHGLDRLHRRNRHPRRARSARDGKI